MKAEKLNDIRKELATRNVKELQELCLSLARYKKENKELLNYILFDSHDPLHFAEQVKSYLQSDFELLPGSAYIAIKSLRKILRLMNRYAKYTASKQVEVELSLWFCYNYLSYADLRTRNQSLRNILIRQMEKTPKLIAKLHEDFQYDYEIERSALLDLAVEKTNWIERKMFM